MYDKGLCQYNTNEKVTFMINFSCYSVLVASISLLNRMTCYANYIGTA